MKPHDIRHSQRGATLIVVLLVTLIIAIIGTMAVRTSTTDLKTATASQVQKLNFQAVDASLSMLEAEARHKRAAEPTGMLGFLRLSDQKIGREVVFCFKPQSGKFFNLTAVTEKTADGSGTVSPYSTGYCDTKESKDYISHRQASMVQLSLTRKKEPSRGEAFDKQFVLSTLPSQEKVGGGSAIEPMSVEAVSSSVLPGYVTASSSSLNGCLQKGADYIADDHTQSSPTTVYGCLKKKGVPFHQQQQTYELKPEGLPTL